MKDTIDSVKVRTSSSDVTYDDYFESIENVEDDNYCLIRAKKRFSADSLNEYETISMFDYENYLVSYEVIANLDSATVTLNAYFDLTSEQIIESFTGIPMMNYNDEDDILFTIDDQRIFLSEINRLNLHEQCSVFGNLLHKALNECMQAVSYLEPIATVLAMTSSHIVALVYQCAKNVNYLANYTYNSSLPQPNDYVYGQGFYKDWKFGVSNMKWAGCEVIAAYNLAHAKNKNYSLAESIFLFESLGIEFGLAQGFFGSNPYQISTFLKACGIKYTRVTNEITFENYMNNSSNYYVILSRWTDESASAYVHTFMIDKLCSRSYKYFGYNIEKKQESYKPAKYWNDFNVNGSIRNTFICAYFVSR